MTGNQLVHAQEIAASDLQHGDLIFVGAEEANLSGAINRVTQRDKEASFDHVGIVERTADSLFVLHASSKKGSIREYLPDFYNSQKLSENTLIVYRLKQDYQSSIINAIDIAKSMLGKPYNWTYILNDTSYYCSDFVERAFRKDRIFILEPMTFVNPTTGMVDEFWVSFYKKQNLAVPQGELGCNPNGLAHSEKLIRKGQLISVINDR